MTEANDLRERVAFDKPSQANLPGGVTKTVWDEEHKCRAQFIYARGGEVVEAARREGRSTFKVRIRSCLKSRTICESWRMRDTRRAIDYNIAEVDAVTDPSWVFIVVESGRAA